MEWMFHSTCSVPRHNMQAIFQFYTSAAVFPEEWGTGTIARSLTGPQRWSGYVGLQNSTSPLKEIQPRFIS